MVAALYVATGGCYFNLEGVDPYDVTRDARLYAGPWPVVVHPECARWGRYAGVNFGDDGGCFAAALASVRRWSGILEHPANSGAWSTFNLNPPPRRGGWIAAGDGLGWTCCVEQGHYGHRARKATWLYAVGVELPSLIWGKSVAKIGPRAGRDPIRERRTGACQRMCTRERKATPVPFRDLLISIAESANVQRASVSQ